MSGESSGRPSVVRRVTERVARARDTPRDELPPLYDAVDPDALETVLATGRPTVRLVYADCVVTVRSPTDIDVRPLDRERVDTSE